MNAASVLDQTAHLFAQTHWTSGALMRVNVEAGGKPQLCAIGGLRFNVAGGIDEYVARESAFVSGGKYQMREHVMDDGLQWMKAAQRRAYGEALYRLLVTINGDDPFTETRAWEDGSPKVTYTLDQFQDGDYDALTFAERLIIAWNDTESRTADEVVAAFRDAAQLDIKEGANGMTQPVNDISTEDLLAQTEHLFTTTHWTNGALLKVGGDKFQLCAIGGLRLPFIGGYEALEAEAEEDRRQYEAVMEEDPLLGWQPRLRHAFDAISKTAGDDVAFRQDRRYAQALLLLCEAIDRSGWPKRSARRSFERMMADDFDWPDVSREAFAECSREAMEVAEDRIIDWNDSHEHAEPIVAVFKDAAEHAKKQEVAA